MSPADREAAAKYLAPIQPSYWDWDDEHTAIAWRDGPTITLRQELALVLAGEQQRGLPPLEPVLLLLAACRDSWRESHAQLLRIVTDVSSAQRYMPMWVGGVLTALEAIHFASKTLLNTPQRKAELITFLFEDQPQRATNAEVAGAVVKLLATKGPLDWPADLGPNDFDLWKVIGQLRDCLQKYDPAAFTAWRQTGLSQSVVPAEIELTAGQRVRSLLTELKDDPELGGLARLARQLLAAITLPRPLAEPDDLPLGGVSDITNRGALDRLLLSELAYDDLTLAVRVATGEALYFRRETPPRSPPLRRTILLDAGLRVWGIPRLFITAVGLALSAAGDEQLQVNTFRACRDKVMPVDLTRQAGLESHLAAIEVDLHPGRALAELQKECNVDDHPSDVVLITTDDSLADDDFRRQLRAAGLKAAWIVAVNREGRVRLLELGQRDLVLKREAKLDLQTILTPPRKPVAPLLTGNSDLPAFCRLKQCPLLLPHDLSIERAWSIGKKQLLSIFKDGRLTWWNEPKQGPKLIAQNMPRGRVLWADSATSHAPFRVVVGTLSPTGMYAVQVWPEESESRCVQLKHSYNEQFTQVNATPEHIFLIGPKRLVAFAWSGEELATSHTFGVHVSGRFFQCGGPNFFGGLHCDGTRIGLATGYTVPRDCLGKILVIAGSSEAPQAISSDGHALDLLSGTSKSLVFHGGLPLLPLKLAAVSRSGMQVALRNVTNTLYVYHVATGSCVPAYIEPEQAVEPDVVAWLQRRPNLRHNFRSITVGNDGRISLVTRKGSAIEIVCESPLILRAATSAVDISQRKMFEAVDSPSGYDLHVAKWEDGSRVWLDSRGLLHFRSSSAKAPEFSLVLYEGRTGGWIADGHVFGNSYFCGEEASIATTAQVQDLLVKFAAELAMAKAEKSS